MFKIAAVALGLAVLGSARPMEDGHVRECRVGNASLPIDIYESFAGWECYERTYPKVLAVYVCVEKSGGGEYSVPCFKVGSKMMSFNLKNEDTVLEILYTFRSQELNDQMIGCYLDLVSACQFSPGGWLGDGSRSFLFNNTDACTLSGQSRFHIAMLSMSLILAVPIVLVFSFCSWETKNKAVFHCRNVLVALVVRTFFTLLVETEVVARKIQLVEEPMDSWAGCEALVSLETITLNLVLAFWLMLTFYLWEYSKNEFVKEPDMKMGIYHVLGPSLVMAVIWMIIMGAGGYGMCWMEKTPVSWVNDSLRISFILVQMFLISVATYRVLTDPATFDDTQKNPLRRVIVFTLALSPLFLLQFSLNAGRAADSDNAYVYTEHFFDGMQCGVVSLSYLFIMGVHEFLMDKIRLRSLEKCEIVLETSGSREVEIGGVPKRAHAPAGDCPKDVIYSSVLTPERFENTIKLYNRWNIIPQPEHSGAKEDVPRDNPDNSSVVSDYYDIESIHTVYDDVLDNSSPNLTLKRNHKYYDSKYLIHDTDSSVSDDSVKEAPKTEHSGPQAPDGESQGVGAVEHWLQNCRCEFEDHVERETKNKNYDGKDIHRSLSGNLLSSRGTPRSVKVSMRKTSKARRASAPSVLLPARPQTFFSSPPENGLPSIYDDLKHTRRPDKPKGERGDPKPKIVIRIATGNRLLQKKRRQVRSMDDLEEPKKKDYGSQLDALLSPRYDTEELAPGDLRKSKFSFNAEQLNIEVGDRGDDRADARADSEAAEPCRN